MDIDHLIRDCVFGEAYCRSLFNFISPLPIKQALEIGFDSGSSALMFLAAKPEAVLTSVDIRLLPNAEALIEKHGFKPRHDVLTGDSDKIMEDLYLKNHLYDYIYIDGDHLYASVVIDLDWAHKLLKDKGYMVIDDCVPNHGLFGVYEAVEDFMKAHPEYTKLMIPGNPNMACVLTRSPNLNLVH